MTLKYIPLGKLSSCLKLLPIACGGRTRSRSGRVVISPTNAKTRIVHARSSRCIAFCLLLLLNPLFSARAQSGEDALWAENFQNVKEQEDFKTGWGIRDGNFAPAEQGGLLVQSDAGKVARLQHLASYDTGLTGSQHRYLQVKVGPVSQGGYVRVSNASKGGSEIGPAESGVTTYDLSNQPFFQKGSSGKWALTVWCSGEATFESIRNVTRPSGGVTIELVSNAGHDGIARRGDTLEIKYHASKAEIALKEIKAELLQIGKSPRERLSPWTCAGNTEITLKGDGNGTFSARLLVDSSAESLHSDPVSQDRSSVAPVFAVRVTSREGDSVGIAGFRFDVIEPSTGQAKPAKDWNSTTGDEDQGYRTEWSRLTQGNELARGKPVQYFPKPNYHLSSSDPLLLTDGSLSGRTDDRIWFTKDAAGWYLSVPEILMVVDLGSEQPVGQIAIRALGGREQGILELPSTIEFLASSDGHTFHILQKMEKLMPAEKDLSDFKSAFYVPEEGKAFVFPFVCRESVNARYVAIRVEPQSSFFTDQISILKSENQKQKDLAFYPEAQIFTEGIVMAPRSLPFTVTSNVVTPNWFLLRNFSVPDAQLKELSCRVKIPEGLKMIAAEGAKTTFKELPSDSPKMREYELSDLNKISGNKLSPIQGPFYFQPIDEGAKIQDGAIATFLTMVSGKESHSIECPLKVVEIPEIPPIDALDISLAWMQDNQERDWPDFLKNFRELGFGFVSTFPRYFAKENGTWSEDATKSLQFLKSAREAGFKIVYNESPFHLMEKAITKAKKDGAIDAVESKEIFNQVNGQPGKWISPLYRGKYFRDEINRVAELVKLVNPDHIYLDIEMWDYNIREARSDPRVLAAWKESGKGWEEFVTDTGKESLGELGSAMKEAAGNKELVVGLYASDPTRAPLYNFYAWSKIYPETVNISMPSIYVQGRALDVAKRVRAAYDALGERRIIPWLTAGTYGAFEPKYMEPMVLEAVLNGASGITYYWFRDFDPMHFYYHAKALSELGKYPKLIREGRPIAYQGDNPNLHYTCFASADEALVLVGNYGRSANGKAHVPLALGSVNSVTDTVGNEVPIKNHCISVDVPAGEFQLFYMGQQKG